MLITATRAEVAECCTSVSQFLLFLQLSEAEISIRGLCSERKWSMQELGRFNVKCYGWGEFGRGRKEIELRNCWGYRHLGKEQKEMVERHFILPIIPFTMKKKVLLYHHIHKRQDDTSSTSATTKHVVTTAWKYQTEDAEPATL